MLNHFRQHPLQFATLQAHRRGLDRQGSGAKRLGFEAIFFQFVGNFGKTAICQGCRSTNSGINSRWR
jgi:hypothetical protein